MLYCEDTWMNRREDTLCWEGYFCTDTPKGKMHIKCTRTDVEGERVEFIGSCDGSCNRIYTLEQEVLFGLIHDSNIMLEERPVGPIHCLDDEGVEWQMTISLAEKVLTKINRWTRRHRWSRQRRLVADLS